MSPRSKSMAALALTLVLGLVVGLLLGGRLAVRRFERLNALVFPPQLHALIRESLELDPAQTAVLDSLMEVQATQISQRIHDHRQLMRHQMDSLLQALRPHLSDEQWQRLQKRLAEAPRRRPGWGPGGPVPGGPGGPGVPEGMMGPGGPFGPGGPGDAFGGRRGPGGPPPDRPWPDDSLQARPDSGARK